MTIQYAKGLSGLSDLTPRIQAVVRAEIQDAAEEIEFLAKEIVPVDTGALQASIHVVPFGDDAVQVRADMPYAAYVEYGTAHAAAQPYMTPAVQAVFPGLERKVAAAIRDEIG